MRGVRRVVVRVARWRRVTGPSLPGDDDDHFHADDDDGGNGDKQMSGETETGRWPVPPW